MSVSIHPLGFIRGGNCDRLHKERRYRELSTDWIVSLCVRRRWIMPASRKSRWKIGKPVKIGFRETIDICKGYPQREIALRRVLQDLLPAVRSQRKTFDLKQFTLWVRAIQKFTFQLGGSLDPIRIVGRIAPPHCDGIYKKRLRAGNFKNLPKGGKQ